MTPAHTDSPLRRSEAGVFREGTQNVTINDDDAERREARRRTLMSSSNTSEGSTFEENETLKKCLEIYTANKLSRDNAWSLSLIDTLSALLDRHHKSLNNFKVAGSSLEASSKVYSLRVDSIHIDVLRLSAGLNAQKFSQRNFEEDDDDDVATGGDEAANPNNSATGTVNNGEKAAAPKKQKRQRKAVSTITKNKESLNARLDTVPLQDPVFGKLNSVVGSFNATNRFMSNILRTTDSKFHLCTNFRFWDDQQLEDCDYTEIPIENENAEIEYAPCQRLFNISYEELLLRPLHTGYIMSDTPEAKPEDTDKDRSDETQAQTLRNMNSNGDTDVDRGDIFERATDMQFDLNATCEPMPPLSEQAPMLDCDYGDFDDLTTAEREAIRHCRGLRRNPVVIEDLRPVDSTSRLEYSYRPLDKISQFWAGPSHWKFRRTRARSSQYPNPNAKSGDNHIGENRGRRANNVQAKKRSKHLQFLEDYDDLFHKLDSKYKIRKTNFQKKWDCKKLKLPTDLQITAQEIDQYHFAQGLLLKQVVQNVTTPDLLSMGTDDIQSMDFLPAEDHFIDDGENGTDSVDIMNMSANNFNTNNVLTNATAIDDRIPGDDANSTILEIADHLEGAPTQVTKIVVPFAKRAKVIDMKSLKRCCTQIITSQMRIPIKECEIPQHGIYKEERYAPGVASFRKVYEQLPNLLTKNMSEALSPSVAFYSVLHLANDMNLRLVPQEDLEDYQIRQLML